MTNRWRVALIGDAQSIEQVASIWNVTGTKVIEEGGAHWLESDRLDSCPDVDCARSMAALLVDSMNGFMRFYSARFHPIACSGSLVELDLRGKKHYVIIADGVLILDTASAVSSSSLVAKAPDLPKVREALLTAAVTDKTVQDVLHFLAKDESWINLYKVYELIRDDIKPSPLSQFVPESDLKRFTATAQSRSAIGDDARHASRQFLGPGRKPPMSLSDARGLMHGICRAWLKQKQCGRAHVDLKVLGHVPMSLWPTNMPYCSAERL